MTAVQYIFRFDDVAPTMRWDRFTRLRDTMRQSGCVGLLGVIPDNEDPTLLAEPPVPGDFWAEMRALSDEGWQIAMHGYRHRYETEDGGLLDINPRSEFAGLPLAVQRQKLERGLERLREYGLETDVFMPPGHSFDRTTLRACRDLGLRAVTDGYALYPYSLEGVLLVPQMLAGPRPWPVGVHTTCFHVNEMSDAQLERTEQFVTRHAARVVPFAEARECVVEGVWNRALGEVFRRGFTAARRVRRRVGAYA